MATATEILLAGVDADKFLVGPAVILLQDESEYENTGEAADAFPRYLDDIINIATGAEMSANGWYYLGYTENLSLGRERTVVHHDADQEAQIKTVHDAWANQITVVALETDITRLREWWQGDSSDPSDIVGAPTAQSKVSVGNPTDINYRRAAILFVDDSDILWGWVYRKAQLHPTGGPTFTRTGKVEWPLQLNMFSDTRTADVNDRVVRILKTDGSIV